MFEEVLTLLAIAFVIASAVLPRLSIDGAALIALAVLVLGEVLSLGEAARGFGNPVLLTVAGMFVLAEGLHRTGAAQAIRDLVQRSGRKGQRHLLLVTGEYE